MKKLLIGLLGLLTLTSHACWFTELNFNTNYIASVNNSAIHYLYSEDDTINTAEYVNGQKVSLPITVQIKISPRHGDQPEDTSDFSYIKIAILQYKIVRILTGTQTSFRTVKVLDNPKWKMNFEVPVNLFGSSGIIDIPDSDISEGDIIIIRLYLSDGLFSTGDLASDIDAADIPNIITKKDIRIGTSGWLAPFVFKVVYSGNRRVMI